MSAGDSAIERFESLPPDTLREEWFEALRAAIAESYLAEPSNPYRQSGRSRGARRWKETRRCLVEAVHRDGDFCDVGCANGLLLESLIGWAAERGHRLRPHGIDFVPELVDLARERHPDHRDSLEVANAFHWEPRRRYDLVRTSVEIVPPVDRAELVRRLHDRAVAPGGRLIVCHYRGADEEPVDPAGVMAEAGLDAVGRTEAPGVLVAWCDRPPTPYPDLDEVLRALVRGIREILEEDLVAACLQGSFAVGDFDEHSDVDFVVAIRRPLSDARVDALQALHGRVFELQSPWAQHLEGSYFPANVLRSCDRRGEPLWYLDNGSRALIEADHCNTAVVRQTVREHGVPLFGAHPGSLVDPIPVGLLRDEMIAVMRDWGAEILGNPEPWRNRFYQGFIALTYCRIWCDWTTGTVGSKRRGAEWAKARLDRSWTDLIDRAWETRPVPEVSVRTPPDPEDWEGTLRLVEHVVERVS